MSRAKSYVVHIMPPRARKAVCGMVDRKTALISAESVEGANRMVTLAPTLSTYAGTKWSVCEDCKPKSEATP